jgi:hypothetical protein
VSAVQEHTKTIYGFLPPDQSGQAILKQGRWQQDGHGFDIPLKYNYVNNFFSALTQ